MYFASGSRSNQPPEIVSVLPPSLSSRKALSVASAVAYGDSELHEVTYADGLPEAIDFGSWTVGQARDNLSDLNGDSIPDAWLFEYRPDLDPRASAEALETAPDCRRRGYARSLFSLLFRELEAEGPFTLTDTVKQTNAASLALHAACGFECFQDPAVSVLTGKTLPGKYGMRYHAAAGPDPSRTIPGKEGGETE